MILNQLFNEGLLHNPGQEPSAVASAITRRILMQRTDLLAKYGPEAVGQAIDEVADFVGDVEEIGSSDVSGWVKHVEQMLGNMEQDVAEAYPGYIQKGKELDAATKKIQANLDKRIKQVDSPEKEIERLKLRQNAEHGGASLKRQASTQARIRELEKQIKDKKGVAEGVATTVPELDAKKYLRKYGADHFKTTTNELHFYKDGRPFSVDLVLNPDTTRSVTISSLNAARRGLTGQGVAEGSLEEAHHGALLNPKKGQFASVIFNSEWDDKPNIDYYNNLDDAKFATQNSSAYHGSVYAWNGARWVRKMSATERGSGYGYGDSYFESEQGVAEGQDTEVTHNGENIGTIWRNGREVQGEHTKSGMSWAGGTPASMAQLLKNHHDAWAKDQARKKQQGVAEGASDTVYPNAEVIKSKNGKPVGEIYQDGNEWGCFHYRADRGYDMIDSREDAIEALKDLHQETGRSRPDYTINGVAEGADERKQNALWAQITAHEKAAKKSKDLKRQHHLKMADQLRSQLKTVDEGEVVALDAHRPTEMSAEFVNWLKANRPAMTLKDLKDPQKRNQAYREFKASLTEAAGQVEAYGYAYNNRDQRVMWRKIFPSSEAAYVWADKKNATVLGVRPVEQTVKEESSTSSEAAESAITRRIMVAHTDLLRQYGPQKVMQAIEEVAYNVGDLDEIGTSDVSGWVNQVNQLLGAQ